LARFGSKITWTNPISILRVRMRVWVRLKQHRSTTIPSPHNEVLQWRFELVPEASFKYPLFRTVISFRKSLQIFRRRKFFQIWILLETDSNFCRSSVLMGGCEFCVHYLNPHPQEVSAYRVVYITFSLNYSTDRL